MKLQILYVEDDHKDYEKIKKFTEKLEKGEPPFSNIAPCTITVTWANTLTDFKKQQLHSFDVILADIFIPENLDETASDKLNKILDHVEEWSKKENSGQRIPVIAYTGKSTQANVIDSHSRDRLYDIWEKRASSSEYAVWRLFKLAQKLYKNRPDTYLQRLIREMSPCWEINWHNSVREMAIEYHSGLTEADQIIKAGIKVKDITDKIDLNFWRQSKKFWDVMEKWEPLSRAIAPNVRGHARHVINVFWLGYYILQHESMRPVVEKWKDNISARNDAVRSTSQGDMDELLKIWFVASIFHDVAGCVEKSKQVYHFHTTEILGIFSDFFESIPSSEGIKFSKETVNDQIVGFCFDCYKNPLRKIIIEYFQQLLKSGHNIDHGLAASLLLMKLGESTAYHFIVKESAKAIALHNIIGNNEIDLNGRLSWDKEPISCLLILCDQLQTWDRERGDGSIKTFNNIESAELMDLCIESSSNGLKVKLGVNYIVPYHVLHAGKGLQNEVKNNLKNVLRAHPYSALEKLRKPWPFQLVFTPYMDMREIDSQHTFGA